MSLLTQTQQPGYYQTAQLAVTHHWAISESGLANVPAFIFASGLQSRWCSHVWLFGLCTGSIHTELQTRAKPRSDLLCWCCHCSLGCTFPLYSGRDTTYNADIGNQMFVSIVWGAVDCANIAWEMPNLCGWALRALWALWANTGEMHHSDLKSYKIFPPLNSSCEARRVLFLCWSFFYV